MNATVQNNPVAGLNLGSLQGMDLETMMMMVQTERTKLLDSQLQSQIKAISDRNNNIAKLNNVLNTLNAAAAAFSANAGPDDKIPNWNQAKIDSIEKPLNDAIQSAGVTGLGFGPEKGQTSAVHTGNTHFNNLPGGENIMKGSTTKAQIDAAITKIKGAIDNQSNSQQMDMLRLQSLTNKRNEAFDVMTNFIKKMQDSRSSIIGNMR